MEKKDQQHDHYLPGISEADWQAYQLKSSDREEFFSLLAEPLHEELYRRQTFEFIYDLGQPQKAAILLDYVRAQVLQGGFIQLIQNGYVGLLVPLIEALQEMNATLDIVQTLDDALKVYVLNRAALDKETSVEEFGKLYDEFREFEPLDAAFAGQLPVTMEAVNNYALEHPHLFFQIG